MTSSRVLGARKPRVIVDPSFRSMAEVFDPRDLDRLAAMTEVVWGRDEPMPADRFLSELVDASAVVFGRWSHGADALDGAGSELRALLEVAGGHSHADLDYGEALERGILVGSCAPAFGAAVAELGLALALGLSRGVVEADRAMRARSEEWLHDGNRQNRTLFGSTIGFVGCGGISVHLQALLEPFQPTLLGYDPPLPAAQFEQRGITPVELPQMFDSADLVFVLAAPTAAARNMVSRDLLERLGPHQGIVVLSRASVVDFDAMVELSARTGFRYATDVYPAEPLSAEDPARASAHGILTPHIAGALPGTLHSIGRMVVDDLLSIFAGEPPTNLQYLTADNRDGLLQTPTSGWAS